jgi:SAM-dependent methyltransferase
VRISKAAFVDATGSVASCTSTGEQHERVNALFTLQDRLLAEVCRCLRPGGLLVGSDTLPSLRFRLYHLADTMVVVDPDRLPGRLEAAGFEEPLVATRAGRLRFRARRPGGQTPR